MYSHRNRSRLAASLLVCLVCGFGSIAARADVPRPKPNPPTPKPEEQRIVVKVSDDADVKEAHLRIPASALRPGDHPSAPRSDSGLSPVRTVVAGISLTAAITIGGLLLVRGRGRGRMLLVGGLLAGAGAIATIATVASADIPRPPERHTVIDVPGRGLRVPVVIEIADDGPIQLTLPADLGKPAH